MQTVNPVPQIVYESIREPLENCLFSSAEKIWIMIDYLFLTILHKIKLGILGILIPKQGTLEEAQLQK